MSFQHRNVFCNKGGNTAVLGGERDWHQFFFLKGTAFFVGDWEEVERSEEIGRRSEEVGGGQFSLRVSLSFFIFEFSISSYFQFGY